GVLAIVALSSPDHTYDAIYLGNFADVTIKDELSRLAGVARVRLVGHGNYSMRVWLDPDRLAARNLTAADVVRALREQNIEARSGPPDKSAKARKPELVSVNHLFRVTDPDQLAEIIVKTDGPGRLVRIRDVAHVELGTDVRHSEAFLNGEPAVFLCVYPTRQARPGQVSARVWDVLEQLRRVLRRGLELGIHFDTTAQREAPGYL